MKNTTVVKDERFEVGSGNPFADLGLANPDEDLLKAHLVHAMSTEIRGASSRSNVQPASPASPSPSSHDSSTAAGAGSPPIAFLTS